MEPAKVQHTSGPWMVEFLSGQGAQIFHGEGIACIATVHSGVTNEDGDESFESNARLIASAPALRAENIALKAELQAARAAYEAHDARLAARDKELQAAQHEITKLTFENADMSCRHPKACADTDGTCEWCKTIIELQAAREVANERIAVLEDENGKLRAVLTTPEVYVGVVTEACEKHWAELIIHEKGQRKVIQAENAALKESLESRRTLCDQLRDKVFELEGRIANALL